jgi:hypothetical protein
MVNVTAALRCREILPAEKSHCGEGAAPFQLAELRKKEDTKVRARNRLLSYTNAGGLKAIC